MIRTRLLRGIIGMLFVSNVSLLRATDLYLSTASDDSYFDLLMNLIGSIHKTNFEQLKELAVFDLNLSDKNKEILSKIQKLKVYSVDMVNPDLLTPIKTTNRNKYVPGCYAWKPVVIKQSLDMFPYFLYLDAGITVLGPLDVLFGYINSKGYFLVTDVNYHGMREMVTQYVIEKFDLNSESRRWIIEKGRNGLAAGLMGITPRVKDNFVLPMYEEAKDIRTFMDDGTAPKGFGWARHDQALFSIYAHLNNLEMLEVFNSRLQYLIIEGQRVPFCFDNHISFSRWQFQKNAYTSFIRFK